MNTTATPLTEIHSGDLVDGPGTYLRGKTVADVTERYDAATGTGFVAVRFTDDTSMDYQDWGVLLDVVDPDCAV